MGEQHLWEPEHRNLCYVEDLEEFDSWKEFIEDCGTELAHFDANLVVRWDWDEDVLDVYFVNQSRGRVAGVAISVTPDDEPAVREWLAAAWARLVALWAPVSEGGGQQADG